MENYNAINKSMQNVIKKSKEISKGTQSKTLDEALFKMFVDYIYENFAINMTPEKKHMLEIKLTKLLEKKGLAGYKEYYNLIKNTKSKDDIVEFLNEITINKTDFFRENNHFEFIKKNINYILSKNKEILQKKEIRVWSSASSTGEEPYTIAMVLKEVLPEDISIKILATDISHNVLNKAIKGEYPFAISNQVSSYYLEKYFNKKSFHYEIKDELKSLVTFREFNLKKKFPFKNKFDIIFCRNVMIYFDSTFQEELIEKFYKSTTKGGLLFIGHSESLNYIKNNFEYHKPTIYKKV